MLSATAGTRARAWKPLGWAPPATIAAVPNEKASTSRSKKLLKAKDLPWALLLQGGALASARWKSLSEKDRARLTRLLRESGGRVGRLSSKQRAELRELLGKLDLKGLGGDLLPLVRRGRGRGKRR